MVYQFRTGGSQPRMYNNQPFRKTRPCRIEIMNCGRVLLIGSWHKAHVLNPPVLLSWAIYRRSRPEPTYTDIYQSKQFPWYINSVRAGPNHECTITSHLDRAALCRWDNRVIINMLASPTSGQNHNYSYDCWGQFHKESCSLRLLDCVDCRNYGCKPLN